MVSSTAAVAVRNSMRVEKGRKGLETSRDKKEGAHSSSGEGG